MCHSKRMVPVIFACIYGTLSIGLGAFVQHALKDVLPQESLQTIQTAARYFFYTAIPILLIFLQIRRGVGLVGCHGGLPYLVGCFVLVWYCWWGRVFVFLDTSRPLVGWD